MTKISSLANINYAKLAKSTAVTVYLMTGVKAIARPMFNLADKKSDQDSKKYSAMNEFLYQVICLGFAFAMIPLCEYGGFKLAEKRLGKILGNKNITKIDQLDGFKKLSDIKGFNVKGSKKISEFKKLHLNHSFDEAHINKITQAEKAKEAKKSTTIDKNILQEEKAEHFINGGIETGSLFGSIIGLTILAPKIGHEILHPIMHAIGMDKKHNKDNAGQPTEMFLADAKVPAEKESKVNINA